jgi:drug/metabolite transporter (DMT)-like permease
LPKVKRERIGVLIAVLSSTFGGTAAAVTRYSIGTSTPSRSRHFASASALLCCSRCALLWRSAFPRGRDRIGASLLGILFFGMFFVLYNIALGYTTAARGALALSTPAALDDDWWQRCLARRR